MQYGLLSNSMKAMSAPGFPREPRDLSRPFKKGAHPSRSRAGGRTRARRSGSPSSPSSQADSAGPDCSGRPCGTTKVWSRPRPTATRCVLPTSPASSPSPAELRSLVSAAVRRVDVTPPVLRPAGGPGTVGDRTRIRWRSREEVVRLLGTRPSCSRVRSGEALDGGLPTERRARSVLLHGLLRPPSGLVPATRHPAAHAIAARGASAGEPVDPAFENGGAVVPDRGRVEVEPEDGHQLLR
jgi:hypothetical protein